MKTIGVITEAICHSENLNIFNLNNTLSSCSFTDKQSCQKANSQVFISCRQYFCNSLLYGASANNFRTPAHVQTPRR